VWFRFDLKLRKEERGLNQFDGIKRALEDARKVGVVGHIMPDGDCISSVLSAGLGLEKLGKEVRMIVDYEIPWYYYEFDAVERIHRAGALQNWDPDVILVLDASSPDRVGDVEEFLEKALVLVVDHHATNHAFGDFNWVDTKFGATAQMVLKLNKALGVLYDPELALYNFIGIATDTGFFRYANSDVQVFEDAAELVRLGANPNVVASTILENKKLEQLGLFCEVVHGLKIECDGLLAYSAIPWNAFEKRGLSESDAAGFVGEMRAIRGVEVAVLFSESKEGEIHVSMRSKKWFDLTETAVHFGGGGHPRAAGFTVKAGEASLAEVVESTVQYLKIRLTQRG